MHLLCREAMQAALHQRTVFVLYSFMYFLLTNGNSARSTQHSIASVLGCTPAFAKLAASPRREGEGFALRFALTIAR